MIFKSQELEKFAVPLPITQENRQTAQEFAVQQSSKEKSEEVLLNTLAVLVVNNYLSMLEIATDLTQTDTWNPLMRTSNNVADLDIPGVGKLECRPIKTSADNCYIPMEVWDSNIGYVIVSIDNELRKAAILGFTSQVKTQNLQITNLDPPEALIDRLHDLQEPITDNPPINLGQWFNNCFDEGWLTVVSLLNPEQLNPAFGFRSIELLEPTLSEFEMINTRVSRAKLINLGIQFNNRNVILLIEMNPEANGNIGVTLQVHPSPNDIYLPEALELQIIESPDEVFMQVQARNRDNYIQLQFTGQPEEVFSVKIILDDLKFFEKFQL